MPRKGRNASVLWLLTLTSAHALYLARRCRVTSDAQRERAWSNPAGMQPWSLALHGPTLAAVVRESDYASITPLSEVIEINGSARASCATHPNEAVDVLRRVAGDARLVALSFQQGTHEPDVFGHMFGLVYKVYYTLLRARALERAHARAVSSPPIRVFIPAGEQPGSRAFAEIAGWFNSTAVFGVVVERAPWVPFCARGCCVQHGGVPAELRARVHLITTIMPSKGQSAPPSFREHVVKALGVKPSARPDTILFVRTEHWSNGRRLHNEPALVRAVEEWAAATHPTYTFVEADVEHLGSFADESRLFARTALLISLFGSSLHLCRLMAPGSFVVEIHGALRNDMSANWIYYTVCALESGLRHFPLFVEGSVPRRDTSKGAKRPWSYDDLSNQLVARVPAEQLLRLLGRIWPASRNDSARVHVPAIQWRAAIDEYQFKLRDHPDPRHVPGSKDQYATRWRLPPLPHALMPTLAHEATLRLASARAGRLESAGSGSTWSPPPGRLSTEARRRLPPQYSRPQPLGPLGS